MDIKAYIESGILEQFVLGMTTPQENAEVIRYAAKYPELKLELDKIEDTIFKFGQAQAVDPPAELKEKILKKIDGKVIQLKDKKSKQNQNDSMSRWELMGLILAMIFAGGTYYFYKQSSELTSQNERLQIRYQALEAQCDKNRNGEAILIKHMAVLKDLNTKPVRMEGTPLSPESNATIYWNEDKKSTLLDITSLPTPSKDKQYQLWAIVDGKPVDMGVFDFGQVVINLKEVPFIKNPQAFAVTLEPLGGVKSPTMDQMYVVGNI